MEREPNTDDEDYHILATPQIFAVVQKSAISLLSGSYGPSVGGFELPEEVTQRMYFERRRPSVTI